MSRNVLSRPMNLPNAHNLSHMMELRENAYRKEGETDACATQNSTAINIILVDGELDNLYQGHKVNSSPELDHFLFWADSLTDYHFVNFGTVVDTDSSMQQGHCHEMVQIQSQIWHDHLSNMTPTIRIALVSVFTPVYLSLRDASLYSSLWCWFADAYDGHTLCLQVIIVWCHSESDVILEVTSF